MELEKELMFYILKQTNLTFKQLSDKLIEKDEELTGICGDEFAIINIVAEELLSKKDYKSIFHLEEIYGNKRTHKNSNIQKTFKNLINEIIEEIEYNKPKIKEVLPKLRLLRTVMFKVCEGCENY
jgi:hypothetical protein